jgi:hypothetical protein
MVRRKKFRFLFLFLFAKHVMTPVRKVAFSGRNLRDKWLFEARSDDFLGQAFGGASRGLIQRPEPTQLRAQMERREGEARG